MLPLFAINNHAMISVSGTDAASFLQSQLSCDINSLSLGKASWASYCNRKGQVISFGLLIKATESQFLWLINTENCALTEQILKRYQLNRKLSIQFESEICVYLCPPHDEHELKLDEQARICTIPHLSSYRLLMTPAHQPMPKSDPSSLLWAKLWVEHQIADIYGACREHYHPIELNYPALDAVHFEKGCYIGQEIVSRLYYRGHTQSKVYAITTDIPLTYGTLIFSDDEHQHTLGQILNGYQEDKISKTLVLFDQMPSGPFYQAGHGEKVFFDFCL